MPVVPEGRTELSDEDQPDVLASFAKTQEIETKNRSKGEQNASIAKFLFDMHRSRMYLQFELITKMGEDTNPIYTYTSKKASYQ